MSNPTKQNNSYDYVPDRSSKSPIFASFSKEKGRQIVISEDSALTVPAFSDGLDIICSTIANLPLKLYKSTEDGTPLEITDDYRLKLVNAQANSVMDAHEYKYGLVKNYLLYGNAITVKKDQNNDNTVEGLYLLEPEKTQILSQVNVDDGLTRQGVYELNSSVGHFEFQDYQVINVARKSLDGVVGKGLLFEGHRILELALQQIEYENQLLAHNGSPSSIVSSDHPMKQEAFDSFKTAFSNLYSGSSSAGRTIFLPQGFSYQALSSNPDDMELTNSKQNIISDIARLLGIPETMINSRANKYNSNEQNNLQFFQHPISGIIGQIESAFDVSFLLESEKDEGYYWSFDTSSILQNTLQEKVQSYGDLYNRGIISYSETRERFGYATDKDHNNFVNMTIGSALYYPDNQNIVIPNTGIVMNAETGEIISNGIRTKDGDGTINDNSIPKEESGDPPESPVQEQDLNRNQEAGSEEKNEE